MDRTCETCGGAGEIANYKHPDDERYGKRYREGDDFWGFPRLCPTCHGTGKGGEDEAE